VVRDLLAAYPITDTLFAMYRRGVVRRVPLMSPDALHMHSLIFRGCDADRAPAEQSDRAARERRVAPRLWLHSAICLALAVLFHNNTPLIWLCIAAYVLVYVLRYRTLARFGRTRRRQWVAARSKRRKRRGQGVEGVVTKRRES
jgi:hypothetical protein